jgi:hypothetical protein
MICIGAVIARSLLLIAALALAAGCNGKADSGADTTLPPLTTASTTPADPYAVPAVIDEAYVNRVLAALDQVEGDVVRSLVANRVPQIDDTSRLRAIYNDPQFQLEADGLIKTTQTGLGQYKNPPGNRKTAVTRLVIVRPDCILVEARTDFTEVVLVLPERPADQVKAITLRRTQDGADQRDLNPTPWSISNAELIKQGSSPQEPQCAA